MGELIENVTDDSDIASLAFSAKEIEERFAVAEPGGPSLTNPPGEILRDLKLAGDLHKATSVLLHGHMRYFGRFATRSHNEKRAIGEFVAKHFIGNGFRGFIHASTTTIAIGPYLARIRDRKTTIYTNSVVLPIAVLRENNQHQVHAVCGELFDEFCGGWIVDDVGGLARFRDLFKLDGARLTVAIFAPMAIKPESGPFFVRHETARLAEIAMAAAKDVILVAPGDRVYREEDRLARRAPYVRTFEPPDWAKKIGQKTTMVIAGRPRDPLTIKEIHNQFKSKCRIRDVVWQNPKTGCWPSKFCTDSFSDANTAANEKAVVDRIERTVKRSWEFLSIGDSELPPLEELCELGVRTPDEFLEWLFACAASVVSHRQLRHRIRATDLQQLIEGVFEINRVLTAYETVRDANGNMAAISSTRVANALDPPISRTGLHKKCVDKLQLYPRDFQEPGITIAELVMRSKALFQIVCRLWTATRAALYEN